MVAPIDASEIKRRLTDAGAYRSGIAAAEPVDGSAVTAYRDWIAGGKHGGMAYLEKFDDLRSDPRLLLAGARSVISCAFSYHWEDERDGSAWEPGHRQSLQWAEYALGDDYHEVVRKRLSEVAEWLSVTTGAECRVCVDTAPLRERYWAVRAGLGFIGLNNQLMVPGAGSRFFLGEILTTLELEPDSELQDARCEGCGRCISACPGRALSLCADGRSELDTRRCLSYLTIEHRGEIPPATELGCHIYGCDECLRVCPHNRQSPPTDIAEFRPRKTITDLTLNEICEMTQGEFSAIFRRSAIKRTKLTGLQRNANYIFNKSDK